MSSPEYKKLHRYEINAYCRRRYAEHRDQLLALKRAAYAANPDKFRKRSAAWSKRNPLRAAQRANRWNDNHPERRKASARRRRERMARQWIEDFTVDDLAARDGWRCWICAADLDPSVRFPYARAPTIDHVIPISSGGPHCKTNALVACWACNRRRGRGVAVRT